MRIILLLTIQFFVLNLSAATFFVTQNGAGSQDGSSWSNAISGINLQTTINNTVAGDEVWIACGTYFQQIHWIERKVFRCIMEFPFMEDFLELKRV